MKPWVPNIPINPTAYPGIKFQRPETAENLKRALPFFYNQLEFIESNVPIVDKVIAGLVRAVSIAETKFDQAFGGWNPASNQFGVAPLRPRDVGRADNRWRWTDSTSTTVGWSNDDTFLSTTVDENELMYIYGYFCLEPRPTTLELYIQPGANKMPIWSLVPMRLKEEKYIIFPEPVIVEPRSQLVIQASTDTGTTATVEEAGLLGYLFAPMSRLLTKRP